MASIDDIVSNLKNGVTNIANMASGLLNAYPAPTTTASPQATGLNSLSTTTTVLAVANNTARHGIVFHNPGTASVYVFPTAIATTPGTTSVGGAFLILPGASLSFPSAMFPNATCSWSAFSGTGSNQALTIVEFY